MFAFATAGRVAGASATLAVAFALSGCGGQSSTVPPGPSANAPASNLGDATASSLSSLNTINSPYVRVLPDGTVIHVAPLPQVRAAYVATQKLPVHVEYHGGSIVKKSTLYAIYWQPAGTYMSPKYKSVVNEYFNDVGTTPQYKILSQYTDRKSNIWNESALGGSWTDTSAYPADFNNGVSGDKDLHAEVLKAIASNNWPNGGIGAIFVIFTSKGAPDDRWAACAYHGSFGPDQTNPYVYSILPYQHDFGPSGCGTPSTVWPNDRDADQTIDTLWHEQAEATSDPNTSGRPGTGGWFSNTTGAEIGDLCQVLYGPLRKDGSNTTLHDHNYVTQEMWSNLGYTCLQTAQ